MTQKQTTIGIDPSSTAVGVACFHGRALASWGILRPSPRLPKDPIGRIRLLGTALAEWLDEQTPTGCRASVVIEAPGARGRAGGRGMITLGTGFGYLLATVESCRRVSDVQVVPVGEWSRLSGGRSKSKDDRADRVARMFSRYERAEDPGLDAADAIGVAAYTLGLFPKTGALPG